MNCLFDPARVVIRVTINKLYFVPEWLVSGVREAIAATLSIISPEQNDSDIIERDESSSSKR